MSKPGGTHFTDEEIGWAVNPATFEAFLARVDVFGHRMGGDPRAVAREAAREERIEFVLKNYPDDMSAQQTMFDEAKAKYFKEMS